MNALIVFKEAVGLTGFEAESYDCYYYILVLFYTEIAVIIQINAGGRVSSSNSFSKEEKHLSDAKQSLLHQISFI